MSNRQINDYIPQIIVGVIITVVGGLALAYFSGILLPRASPSPPATRAPTQVQQVTISYQLSGRYVILGPNPGGIWASQPGATNKYLWHELQIQVVNDCSESIFIDSDLFRLYIAEQPSTEQAEYFEPTREGRNYQKQRIPDEWLEPGKRLSGTLYFRVPESTLRDGTKVDSAHNIVRYTGDAPCKLTHLPN